MLNNVFAADPHYKDFVEDFRALKDDELPEGVASGSEFSSVCINTMLYLPWLVGQCRRNSVSLHRGSVAHVRDVRIFPGTRTKVDVVINTTGLGALKLGGVNDQAMFPIRGQTVVVGNVAPFMQCHSGTDDGDEEACYMMTRASGGGTILGGTTQVGNWESQPDLNIASRIMKRALEMMPELTAGKGVEGLDIIRHGVGLRPGREGGVRLEKENIDGTWVVHNYGHSGWGYQGSYGCAEEVVALVSSITPKAKL
jgi:D-amino-acid oxidase